jgi:hypothetical protein
MSNTNSVKIEKIVLVIGDKEIKLSVEEAKELSKILKDVFGDNTPYVQPYAYPYVYPQPYYPYWKWKYEPKYNMGGVTYQLTTGSTYA